jgi:hypothetical protein
MAPLDGPNPIPERFEPTADGPAWLPGQSTTWRSGATSVISFLVF